MFQAGEGGTVTKCSPVVGIAKSGGQMSPGGTAAVIAAKVDQAATLVRGIIAIWTRLCRKWEGSGEAARRRNCHLACRRCILS
jgi:hypothetical protein